MLRAAGWLRRICVKFDISLLYDTPVGIKCTNTIVSSTNFEYLVSAAPTAIPAAEIHLPLDGLKDDHTLLKTPVPLSPHYQLMETFMGTRAISDSEYVRRAANGTLDFRPKRAVTRDYLGMLEERFQTTFDSIQADDYEPIMVMRVENCYYVADGKHRAALCAVLNKTPRCVDVSPVIYDSFFWWIFGRMQRNPEPYSKHIKLFTSLTIGRR